MPYDVVGLGNALVDVQVHVDDSVLEELRLPKGGMTLADDALRGRVLRRTADRPRETSSGGSAANTMHGIAALGGRSYHVGRVADDEFGRLYAGDMAACSVGFPAPRGEGGTGTVFILVTPDAERTMVTTLGVSVEFDAETVDLGVVRDARILYVEGYLWDGAGPRTAARAAAAIGREHGIPVAFTLSDAFLIDRHRESLHSFVAEGVDILFCNAEEAVAFTDRSDPKSAASTLAETVGTAFVTLGAEGALIATNGAMSSVHAFPADAVDTTGAGDLFAAGVLYGLTHGEAPDRAAIIGAFCAARIVERAGARLPQRYEGDVGVVFETYRHVCG